MRPYCAAFGLHVPRMLILVGASGGLLTALGGAALFLLWVTVALRRRADCSSASSSLAAPTVCRLWHARVAGSLHTTGSTKQASSAFAAGWRRRLRFYQVIGDFPEPGSR